MTIKNPIAVLSIWAVVESESDAPWLVEAWDEYVVDGNYEGWLEAINKAKAEYGDIRILTTSVDYEAIQRAFMPVAVANSGVSVVAE